MAALRDALAGGTGPAPRAVFVRQPGEHPPIPDDVPAGTAIVIHTSGSTGTPKFVALSAEAVRASAEATHDALGGSGQWLIALPTHRIAGLQTITRSIIAGTEPIFIEEPFKPSRFFTAADRMSGERRYVSLVPVQLARLLDAAERAASEGNMKQLHALASFDAVLIGGQAVPLALRSRAYDHGIKLVRTYGMTETAGGLVYDGLPIGDAKVRIRDGEVQLAGPMLALGYPGDPERTEAVFINDDGERWFRTGDAGELLGGVLNVTGRLDRVFISGGVNVSLDEVERVLHEVDDWVRVAAVAIPDDTWGERVVLATGDPHLHDEDTLESMKRTVREQLGAAAVPVSLMRYDNLPRLDNGKPDYRSIRADAIVGSPSPHSKNVAT